MNLLYDLSRAGQLLRLPRLQVICERLIKALNFVQLRYENHNFSFQNYNIGILNNKTKEKEKIEKNNLFSKSQKHFYMETEYSEIREEESFYENIDIIPATLLR